MSTAIAKNFQIGADGTATNNFTIFQPASPDGTLRIGNGNTGITTGLVTLTSAGNLGLGVTPSAWGSGWKAAQFGTGASISSFGAYTFIGQNWYNDGANVRYIANGFATYHQQQGGIHSWHTAPSGTAGNAISFTQAMTLDASGRLGIGTTSPAQMLDVQSGSSPTVRIRNTAAAVNNITQLLFEGTNTFSGTSTSFIQSISLNAGNSSTALVFGTNADGGGAAAERARIDSVGRFLVNNASSLNSDAYIQATGGPYPIWIQGSSQGYTQGAMVISSATTDNPSGRGLGIYMWNQATTATWYTGTAYGSGDNWFIMRKTGGAFRPDTADVALGWLMLMSASGAGYQGNNSSTWSTTSDARVKDDVQTIENGLDVVLALRPVDFYNKVTKKREENFIAQEYEQVLAKHVTREKPVGAEQEFVADEILRLNPNLVPYLVSAIQKLNAKVEAQAAEIAALKGQA